MHRIILPAHLDREGVRLTADELRDALGRGGPVAIDGAQVDRVGMAGLQLLLSATRPHGAGEPDIRIVAPSAALIEAATVSGLTAHLGFEGADAR